MNQTRFVVHLPECTEWAGLIIAPEQTVYKKRSNIMTDNNRNSAECYVASTLCLRIKNSMKASV